MSASYSTRKPCRVDGVNSGDILVEPVNVLKNKKVHGWLEAPASSGGTGPGNSSSEGYRDRERGSNVNQELNRPLRISCPGWHLPAQASWRKRGHENIVEGRQKNELDGLSLPQ
jgi:hypothetical protein